MELTRLAALGAALMVAGAADGKSVRIDGLGGAIALQAKDVSHILFGGSATPSTFTGNALVSLHSDINGSGVATDGMVSIILAETNFGLSLMALIDDQTPGASFQSTTGTLGFTSTVSRSDVTGPNQWINDNSPGAIGGDIQVAIDEPGNLQFAGGLFRWDAVSEMGDGFGWSDLRTGDSIAMGFTEFSDMGFQFLSWDGSSWSVVEAAEFSVGGQFAYTATVIPLPAGASLGLIGLAAVAGARRRR